MYAGTPLGLADSKDEGLTWHYRRGVDWKAKLAGLYHPIVPDERPISGDLLHDDYVTCLGEDGAGRLFIGHRQGGVEVFDPKLGKRVQSGANGGRLEDYIGALLVQDYAVWVGMYGGGLLPPAHPEAKSASSSPAPSIPALPVPAAPPTLAQLNTMLTRVKSLTGQMPVGSGAYLGEDWQTQGDWVGRYGSRYAVLCAAAAPLDEYVLSDPSYTVTGFSGPHHREGDGLRSWCHWVHTNDSRVLWNPIAGYRRETEWDDHAEAYPQSFAGPDVWAKVSVPAGLHRLSLYLMNKDGHDGDNRYRDYLVELKHLPSNPDKGKDAPAVDPDTLPILTAARVHDFWFGVYERFLVSGPADYFVKVGKNGSFNTILQTVMLDKVSGPPTDYETRRSIWYGADLYQPPVAPHLSDTSPVVNAAQRVWEELDQNSSKQAASNLSTSFRILAYRALLASPRKSDDANTHSLAESWRWQLCLWNKADRETFQQAMAANREPLLAANPKLALGNQ